MARRKTPISKAWAALTPTQRRAMISRATAKAYSGSTCDDAVENLRTVGYWLQSMLTDYWLDNLR